MRSLFLKSIILSAVLLLSLLTTEILLRYVVKYPVYGLDYKVHYRISDSYWTNIWKPYSRYWNVEGGNVVYLRNNLGLPGININEADSIRVAVLGSSFIEAYQLKPDRIATSLLNKMLYDNGSNAAVYNLGYSAHDPYDSYMRMLYYHYRVNPGYVILVINSDNAEWFKRHKHPLSFVPDKDFGQVRSGKLFKIQTIVRNNSSLVALIAKALSGNKTEDIETNVRWNAESSPKEYRITDDLAESLNEFKQKYKTFAVVSIVGDTEFNDELAAFCSSNDIVFKSRPMIQKQYLLHGAGHLNERGNQLLAQLLYSAYIEMSNHKTKTSQD